MLRRGLKLTALATVVVLALTGFSTGRGKGSSGKSKGGYSSSHSGGGCSSSKQNHGGGYTGSHHSDYDDDDDYSGDDSYGSGGTDTATPTPASSTADASFVIVDCAGPDRTAGKRRTGKRADSTVTLRVTSLRAITYDFGVGIDLRDRRGDLVEHVSGHVTLDAGQTRTVTLKMMRPGNAARVAKCADPIATAT